MTPHCNGDHNSISSFLTQWCTRMIKSHLRAVFALTLPVVPIVNAQVPTSNEVRKIAERAYIYAYPLVVMEATGAAMPLNRLMHVAQFPGADFRLIVRPNADTLYSTAWLDVSKEPLLLRIPDSGGRFYLLQFMDAWTETFADPGKRTTGTSEAWYAIVGPGWSGRLPDYVVRLDAPTNHVWLLGPRRTASATMTMSTSSSMVCVWCHSASIQVKWRRRRRRRQICSMRPAYRRSTA